MTVQPQRGWVPDPATDFGARLALVRQRQGWNIRQAATACGLDAESWRHWETQNRMPRRMAEVCAAIGWKSGADYVWLMTGYVPDQRGAQVTGDYVARIVPFPRLAAA